MGNINTFWGRFIIGMEAGAKGILKLLEGGMSILPTLMLEISDELDEQKKN